VKALAFSDLHCDTRRASRLVQMSAQANVVIGAGDFGAFHDGLEETIDALWPIETPTVVVPGNHESADELRKACAGWNAARVLHGQATEIDGVPFLGMGSEAILRTIEKRHPRIAVCGHIHECWGEESRVGETRVLNLGPAGALVDF
jgi:uncharacterized protein